MTNEVVVIDISHWQGDVDFAKVKKSLPDLVGIFMKASDGTASTDAMYKKNRAAAEAVGFSVASYHYFQPGRAEDQMAHYLDVVEPGPGERLVIDYEQNGCTVSDLVKAVAYLQRNAPDCELTVYGASKLTDDVSAYTGDLTALKATSLWAARYSSNQPTVATKVWSTWSLWQFTQEGQCDGIDGEVDMNRFNGSTDNAAIWFGPLGVPVPLPQPTPSAPFVTTIKALEHEITVSIDAGVVAIWVDGEPWGESDASG